MKKIVNNKYYYIIYIITVIVSFIPLFLISFYAHPSADDYNYSIQTCLRWNETGSIIHLIKTAFEETVSRWYTWQGLYSSAFLLSLQPAIFGEAWYCLTGIIMLCLLVGGNLIISLFFVTKFLRGTKIEAIVIGLSISYLAIQWMPSISQGLYWYNGAMNYGFFYFLLELSVCVLIGYLYSETRKKEVCLLVIACLLIFVLEGGNHVTAFIGVLFCLLVLGIAIYKKQKTKSVGLIIVGGVAIGGFLLNILSPGTTVRANALEMDLGVIECICLSIKQVLYDVKEWTDLNILIVLVCISPILLKMALNLRMEGFEFRFPIILPIFSILVLGAMYCPPMLAMGSAGDGRLVDIVYYSYILMLFICTFYFEGWVLGKMESIKILLKMNGILVLIFLLFVYTQFEECWGGIAWIEMDQGVPQAYSEQAYQRDELFSGSEGKDLQVEKFSNISQVIFFRDITTDKNFWRNKSVARYYNLNSVCLYNDYD